MAAIYHQYGRGDSTFICPQRKDIDDASPQLQNTVRRLSEQSERHLSQERRRSSIASERASVLDNMDLLRQGKLPTNHQLNSIIDRLLHSNTIENNKKNMSEDGVLLLNDFQQLLMTLQSALRTKNRDELFQSMIYHVKKSEEIANHHALIGQPRKSQLKTTADAVLKLAKLFLFNSQFRGLLNQILNLAQQVMGNSLEHDGKLLKEGKSLNIHAASANNNQDHAYPLPGKHLQFLQHRFLDSEEDKPIKDDSGHSLDNPRDVHHYTQQDQHHDIPQAHQQFLSHRFMDFEESGPIKDDGGNAVDSDIHHLHDSQNGTYLANSSAISPSAQVGDIRIRPLTPSSLYEKHTYDMPAVSEDDTQHKGDLADVYHQNMSNKGHFDETEAREALFKRHKRDSEWNYSGAVGALNSPAYYLPASDNGMNHGTPSTGKATVHKYRATFIESTVSDGDDSSKDTSTALDQIMTQLKKIMITIQKNPEYQQAMSVLLTLFSDWGNRLTTNSDFQRFNHRSSSTVDPSEQGEYYLYTSSREGKTILEDWAQGKSLDPIIEKGNNLAEKLKQDSHLKDLCNKVTNYIQRLLQEPDYLEADQSTQDGQELIGQIRQHAFDQYRSEANDFAQEASDFVNTVSEDPISKDISDLVKSIHKHLWYDKNGYVAFKPQLLNDIRITLIPALIEQFHYIALPRIVYSDRQYEIALENLLLAGDTLLPKVFEIKIQDFLRFSPSNMGYTNVQSMHIDMAGIQTVMEDVIFYYKKKAGFPRLTDSGVVSLRTEGEGLKLSMVVTSNYADQKHAFRLDQCHCVIDKLFIQVKHSKHNMLYKVLNPVLTGIVKRQMAKSIEAKLYTLFEEGDAKVTKYLYEKQENSSKQHSGIESSSKRPGLFSHIVGALNKKISNV
ncbi:Uncharacterized protein C32A11.02c [Choanephora cucurbitarum]|uniref:Uncharacterized protein C32A11.02c n=1 Tax=Choanephora cucurbitarum TaxID=101091 RepID=A0A1C7NKB9_9FUNG|nr:Uncharacterized protein C32A11.02c [Choanephora cucurbitarum]